MTIRLDMTPEDKEKLLEEIFKASETELRRQMDYVVGSEMRMDMASHVRRVIAKRVAEIADPLIEKHKERIQKRAEQLASSIEEKVETAILEALTSTQYGSIYEEVARGIDQGLSGLGRRISKAIFDSIKKQLEAELTAKKQETS